MAQITAIMQAYNEPPNIKALTFGGIPKAYDHDPKAIDIVASTDDGYITAIERKTPEDFLGTLGSNDPNHQLLIQLARMAQPRYEQENKGERLSYLPYLVITESFVVNHDGMVITDRGVTGWEFKRITGTLLSIQEMGIFVTFADSDADFEDCVLRIGRRSRGEVMNLLPPRPANVLGDGAVLIQSLAKGIGIEKTQMILDWSDGNPADALCGLVDLSIPAPVGYAIRKRIRNTLRLQDNEILEKTLRGEISTPVKGDLAELLIKETN